MRRERREYNIGGGSIKNKKLRRKLVFIGIFLVLLVSYLKDHEYNDNYEILDMENGPYGKYEDGYIYIGDDDYLESILNYVDKNVFPINLKEASLYLDMIKKNNDINFINDISYKTIVTDNKDMYKYDKPDEYYKAKLKRLGCSWINNVKE